MSQTVVHQQLHGYRSGHQLLSASLVLDPRDQDVVNSLSDLAGGLRPGERFDPYLTAYPLPGRSHYVLARTFQDLQAPRSGCVQTRSLFIPMDTWVELKNINSLLSMLVRIHEGEKAQSHNNFTTSEGWPEMVCDKRVTEIVQVLFFEDVRPVVVFDAAEAEVIASRLLVALWPGLRGNFSVCTLALGPRRLGTRDFDLLFAPQTVQSRFSGDLFRRIGVHGSMSSEALHHLAAPTAARIFHSEEPCLVARDVLAFLADDELHDRAAVRMVLRWEELASRAKTTPTAVLGMLDILNSRGGASAEVWDRLSSTVARAIDSTTAQSTPQESWDFLIALIAKIELSTPTKGLSGKLEEVVRSLARVAPDIALRAIEDLDASGHRSAAVLKGAGHGVAESQVFESMSDRLQELAPNALLSLVDASDRLGEALVTAMNVTVDQWIDTVMRMLDGDDIDACRRVRRRLVALVDDAVAGAVLPRMLADVGGVELADMVVELGCRGRFQSDAINTVLAKAARNTGSVNVVRDAVKGRVDASDADAFLLKVVELKGPDLEWLFGVADKVVAGRLLTALLADADERAIRSVLSAHDRSPRAVSVLRAVLPGSASEIARILQLGLMSNRAGLEVGFEIVSKVPREKRRLLEKWLVREALTAARPGDTRVGKAIAEFRESLTAEELVDAATAASLGPRRVSENLVAVNAAPHEVREGVIQICDTLSKHLVKRHREELDEAAYRAWAEILADGSASDPERRIMTAVMVLGFALRHVSFPASALVVSSFPTVYRERAKLKSLGKGGRDLFGKASYSWASWKKRKDIRLRLIDALVGGFLKSSWPPADLIVAVLEADIGERVVKRVRKKLRDTRYIEKISEDARRLDDEMRRRVLDCVAGEA